MNYFLIMVRSIPVYSRFLILKIFSIVKRIATYVKEKYNVTSIIWDDMLRQFSPDFVKSYDLAEIGVELMIWTYVDDIYRFIPTQNWMFYAESFQKIWGASAFKGKFFYVVQRFLSK